MTTYMHYGLSDDLVLYRDIMGYWGGSPLGFSLYLQPYLSYPLAWLSAWIPGIPWFGITQLAFLWFSCVVICKALLLLARRTGHAIWMAYGLYLLFSFAFLMERCSTITYSSTAAVVMTAAVVQLFAAENPKPLKELLLSVVLIFMAYAIRITAMLPGLLVWGAVFLFRMLSVRLRRKGTVKPYLKILAITAACFAAAVGLRTIELQNPDKQDYIRWQNDRIDLVDYTNIYAFSVEDFQSIGLSEKDLILYEGKLLWESDFTAEKLEEIQALYDDLYANKGDTDLFSTVKTAMLKADQKYYDFPDWWRIAGLLILLAVALSFANGEKWWAQYLLPLGIALIALVMLGYLAVVDRYPTQALVSVLYPVIAALMCIAFTQLPKKMNYRMILAVVIMLPCLYYSLHAAKTAYRFYTNPQPGHFQHLFQNECTEYINQHPDQLFWIELSASDLHNTLYSDTTVTYNALPLNGWGVRSLEMAKVLRSFAVDPEHFSYSVLLREDMRIITANESPSEALLEALSVNTDRTVIAERIDTYGKLNIFRLIGESEPL